MPHMAVVIAYVSIIGIKFIKITIEQKVLFKLMENFVAKGLFVFSSHCRQFKKSHRLHGRFNARGGYWHSKHELAAPHRHINIRGAQFRSHSIKSFSIEPVALFLALSSTF
jgi:hypothetical protein